MQNSIPVRDRFWNYCFTLFLWYNYLLSSR